MTIFYENNKLNKYSGNENKKKDGDESPCQLKSAGSFINDYACFTKKIEVQFSERNTLSLNGRFMRR